MDEELDYRGTQVSPIEPISPVSQDIADKGAIEAAIKHFENRAAYYGDIDSLGTDEKDFTVKEQLRLNKQMKTLIAEEYALFTEVIENLKGQG